MMKISVANKREALKCTNERPTFTLFAADCVGVENNVYYPHEVKISDADTLRGAVKRDYVPVRFKNF